MTTSTKRPDGGELSFQKRALNWLMECFSNEVCRDGVERNHRFLEESLELVQSLGCTRSEAHQLVDYVFGRPIGEPFQELGGVMVTVSALASCHDMDFEEAAETELARVWTKIEKIRAKQLAKPKHSPLPETAPAPQALPAWVEDALDRSPATRQEILRTGELASQFGWTDTSPTAPAPDVREALNDPNVVHLNMLRGGIARPTREQIKHLYPELFSNNPAIITDFDRFYGDPVERFKAMADASHDGTIDAAHFKMWCRIAEREIRHARAQQPVAVADQEAITPFSVVERTLVEFFSANDVQTEEDGGEWLAYLGIDEEEFSLTGLATAITSALLHPQPAKGERP